MTNIDSCIARVRSAEAAVRTAEARQMVAKDGVRKAVEELRGLGVSAPKISMLRSAAEAAAAEAEASAERRMREAGVAVAEAERLLAEASETAGAAP